MRPAHQHQLLHFLSIVSHRMRVSGKCLRENVRSQGVHCPFRSVLVLSRRCRPRLLHLRRLIERVVDECAKFITQIGHCGEKKCGLNKENRLPRQRPLSDRNSTSEQSFMPKRLPILKISGRSVADVLSEILGLQQIAIAGTSFDS